MNKEDWIKNIIILSGGFDPVHKGHIRMFREAANLGANVRKKEVIIPKSDFVFEKKDLVVFLTKREHLEKVESLFRISSLI